MIWGYVIICAVGLIPVGIGLWFNAFSSGLLEEDSGRELGKGADDESHR